MRGDDGSLSFSHDLKCTDLFLDFSFVLFLPPPPLGECRASNYLGVEILRNLSFWRPHRLKLLLLSRLWANKHMLSRSATILSCLPLCARISSAWLRDSIDSSPRAKRRRVWRRHKSPNQTFYFAAVNHVSRFTPLEPKNQRPTISNHFEDLATKWTRNKDSSPCESITAAATTGKLQAITKALPLEGF